MSKNKRNIIFDKYGGKCAYCGCELVKGWHIDHLLPVVRDPFTGNKKFPERDNIENMMPSCASCNINKHSESIEWFRKSIAGYMKHLNEVSTQYKIAKRFGLIKETDIEVKFYYESKITFNDYFKCESCGKTIIEDDPARDSDDNNFCKECWEELEPILKAEYEELKQKGEID